MTRYYHYDQYGRVTHSTNANGCGLALGVTVVTLLCSFIGLLLLGYLTQH